MALNLREPAVLRTYAEWVIEADDTAQSRPSWAVLLPDRIAEIGGSICKPPKP